MKKIKIGTYEYTTEDAHRKFEYIKKELETMKFWETSDFMDFYHEDVPFLVGYIEWLKTHKYGQVDVWE